MLKIEVSRNNDILDARLSGSVDENSNYEGIPINNDVKALNLNLKDLKKLNSTGIQKVD